MTQSQSTGLYYRRFWFLTGISLSVAIALALYSYELLSNRVTFGPPPHRVCLRALGETTSTCFAGITALTGDKTTAIAVSPDGQLLVNSSRQSVQIWQLSTGKLLHTLTGHSSWVMTLAISPDGQTLATSSLDKTVKIWNLPTGQLLQTLPTGRVTTLAISPNGAVLAAGSRTRLWLDGRMTRTNGVQLWDLRTGRFIQTLGGGPVNSVAFNPVNSVLVVGSGNTQFWDLYTRQVFRTLDSGQITKLMFSSDGRMLVTGSSRVKVWDTRTGKLLQLLKTGSSDVAVSPKGDMVAVASGGNIEFWHLQTGRLMGELRGSTYSALDLAFGLKGQLLVSGSSDGVKVWRSQSPKPVAQGDSQ